jgi:hypothetical protein
LVETSVSMEINRTGNVIRSENRIGKTNVENKKLFDLKRVENSH